MRVLLAAVVAAAPAIGGVVTGVQYLGQESFPTGFDVLGTNMGGLSGIMYDAQGGQYLAISDDRSQFNPARFYNLTIDLSNDVLMPGRIGFTGVTDLLNASGATYPALGIDPEGIALAPNGDVYVSSEGQNSSSGVLNPFVNRYNTAGQLQAELSVPAKFLPQFSPAFGVRNNLAFETLTISPSQNRLFTATENALNQDGLAAAVGQTSTSRVLSYDLNGVEGAPGAEYVYVTDAVATDPVPPGSFATNGLVDMLAIDDTRLIAVERSFSTGVGNAIKLYEVSLDGATDVSASDTLPGSYTPVSKELILDLGTLGITLDNIEGITWGPALSDGRRSIVLVSDNNFSATQFTQFLAFGVTVIPEPSTLMILITVGLAAAFRR